MPGTAVRAVGAVIGRGDLDNGRRPPAGIREDFATVEFRGEADYEGPEKRSLGVLGR